MGEGLKRAFAAARATKYGNRKVTKVTRDGKSETFDSVREYERHLVLLDMQRKGDIRKLERQVTFNLIVNGVKVGSVRPDWTYEKDQGEGLRLSHRWVEVAEDAKGFQTPDHKTRWKLAKALYPQYDWRLS